MTCEADIDLPVPPPETRAGCADLPRPCPATSCRHHLAPEIAAAMLRRNNKLKFEGGTESCSLDYADRVAAGDRENATDVGRTLGLTRETIRQVEETARAVAVEDEFIAELGEQAGVGSPEFQTHNRPKPKPLAYVAIDHELLKRLRDEVGRSVSDVFEEAVRIALDPKGEAARAANLRRRLKEQARRSRPNKARIRDDRKRLERPPGIEARRERAEQALRKPEPVAAEEREETMTESTDTTDTGTERGDEIVAARKAKGWSRAKLAKLAGIDVKTAVRAEAGLNVSQETAVKIAAALAQHDDAPAPETPAPVAHEPRGTSVSEVPEHIERVIRLVLDSASDEAVQTERDVRFYRLGMAGKIPDEWREFDEQARREADPEWAEYLRLAQKFGQRGV